MEWEEFTGFVIDQVTNQRLPLHAKIGMDATVHQVPHSHGALLIPLSYLVLQCIVVYSVRYIVHSISCIVYSI